METSGAAMLANAPSAALARSMEPGSQEALGEFVCDEAMICSYFNGFDENDEGINVRQALSLVRPSNCDCTA
jgi:hypothetical protein